MAVLQKFRLAGSQRRAAGVRGFFDERSLRIGFVALLCVAAVMLAIQLWFSLELKEASSAASRLRMRDLAIAVISDVDEFYRKTADTLLTMRPSEISQGASIFRRQFRRRWAGLAKGFFILDLRGTAPVLNYYDAALQSLGLEPSSPQRHAIELASARWVVAARQAAVKSRPHVIADGRDEQNPVLMKPILSSNMHAV